MEGLGTFALGVAAAVVAQAGGPSLARKARPVVRGILKQAIILGQGARVRTEGLRQDLEDLAAEARVEARQEARQQQATGSGAGS
ncbi:MAG TPA: DUF5132 domain-containing protein [Myxococcota bacterium]|nr:DUF5132 domain-containing protein [Myxococcota bacterium]